MQLKFPQAFPTVTLLQKSTTVFQINHNNNNQNNIVFFGIVDCIAFYFYLKSCKK